MVRRGSQASDSAALRAAAVLLCVMLFTMDSFATAANVVVGGNAGWTGSHNYGRMTAKSGDALVFNYSPQFHNVFEVSQEDYNRCATSKPIKKYSSGRDFVKVNSAGSYYFICGVSGHCSSGMKVAVTVH